MTRALAFLLLIASLSFSQTTYYVSTSGTDGSGHSGSSGDPWTLTGGTKDVAAETNAWGSCAAIGHLAGASSVTGTYTWNISAATYIAGFSINASTGAPPRTWKCQVWKR